MSDSLDLPAHQLSLALFSPQIAPNVGNIGRTCVATGTSLHLVRPFGFALNDAKLKRAGLDYWDRLDVKVHDDLESFLASTKDHRLWFFDSIGSTSIWDAQFKDGDVLCLGSETRGIDPEILSQNPSRVLRIPQSPGERCLNLATSAGIVLYEALRQIGVNRATPT